jgi:DNA primase
MTIGSSRFKRALAEHEENERIGSSGPFLHHVDVADFLSTLQIENVHKAKADEFNFSCPFPGHTHGDASPSAYMNDGSKDKTKTSAWKCWGCGRTGNGITFYAELAGVSKAEAAAHIRLTWAPRFRAPKGGTISKEFELRQRERRLTSHVEAKKDKTIPWNDYLRLCSVDWNYAYRKYRRQRNNEANAIISYLFTRGFTPQALESWKIGYDPQSQRYTIPVCNINGDLVGVKGRTAIGSKRKYMVLGDRANHKPYYRFMPYEKTLVVFGLDRAKKARKLVLVEGELDVVALWQIGIPAISPGSAHLSDEQALLIRDYADEVIFFFDSNDAGENATWGWEDSDGEWHPGAVEKLAPFMRVRVVAEHEHDASELIQHGRVDELRALLEAARPHYKFGSVL